MTVPVVQSPSTRVTCAVETATRASVSLVTAGGVVPGSIPAIPICDQGVSQKKIA